MRIFIMALCLGLSGLLQAQGVEYQVVFDEQCYDENWQLVSEPFKIVVGDSIPFVGISAYVMEEGLKADLQYRILQDEQWREWRDFEKFHEGATPGRTTFEGAPLQERASAIQFRSSVKISKPVVFRLFFPDKKTSLREGVESSATVNSCYCNQPLICGRECWCPAGNCPKDSAASPTVPTHIIIHHSAGFTSSNNYQWVVAYYYDLHVNTNGWSDIGYNWLIDNNGVVYEGRGSGVTGAHFSCMNSYTSGICMIGNYMDTTPTDTALQQLKRLIAWESCDKNINPANTVYHQTSQLFLPVISSHRDGNQAAVGCPKGTACPGDSLYALLPWLRSEISAFQCLEGVDLDEREISDWELWPNPARGEVRLKFSAAMQGPLSINIRDARGNILRQLRGRAMDLTEPLSLENLSTGLYWVEVKMAGHSSYQKLMLW